ncbi:hypothetical protein H2248_004265 [Termitomyces sp. 'cryptogamus']|nr:hypothetical protein H2248_004265 [Termitomyces sp. 'cryptogamus']
MSSDRNFPVSGLFHHMIVYGDKGDTYTRISNISFSYIDCTHYARAPRYMVTTTLQFCKLSPNHDSP